MHSDDQLHVLADRVGGISAGRTAVVRLSKRPKAPEMTSRLLPLLHPIRPNRKRGDTLRSGSAAGPPNQLDLTDPARPDITSVGNPDHSSGGDRHTGASRNGRTSRSSASDSRMESASMAQNRG